MTDKEKYWLAGLLEGEGSFMKPPPSHPNQPRIKIEMSDNDVIERVRKLFGVSYIYEHEPEKGVHSTTWRVTLKGRSAVKVMKRLKPLMGERRTKQIEEAINAYDPYYKSESKSEHSKEEVKEAWSLIQDGMSLTKVSDTLNLPYQFVKDLNNGRTWKELTGL